MELLFVMVFIVETRGEFHRFFSLSSSGRGLAISGCTLEETAALFDGRRIPRDIDERRDEAPIALTLISPQPTQSSYPDKDVLESYLELQKGSGARSCISSSRSMFGSQSEDSIGFAK